MVTVRGCNDFYEGWLSYFMGRDRPEHPYQREGWKMAQETGELLTADVLRAEIAAGHIIVDA